MSRIDDVADRCAPAMSNQRVRVGRLRLIGRANAGRACPCTDPLRLVRHLRHAVYVLAIAIVVAAAVKAFYDGVPRLTEGHTPGLYDRTGPEAGERLGADLQGLLRTAML